MEHGLINEGATCYFNVIVQLLYAIPTIRNHIMNSSSPELLEWRNLYRSKPFRCNRLLTQLELPFGTMMDISEVMLTKVFPLLMSQKEQFELCYVKENLCNGCGSSSLIDESYFLFPINQTDEILTHHLNQKLSLHHEELFCTECSISDRLIGYHGVTLPQHLFLYDMTSTSATNKKSRDVLVYEDFMDIQGQQYALKAVIYHHGLSAAKGHYTITICLSESESTSEIQRKLVHYDDAEMKEVNSFGAVTTYASGKIKVSVRPVLFYYEKVLTRHEVTPSLMPTPQMTLKNEAEK